MLFPGVGAPHGDVAPGTLGVVSHPGIAKHDQFPTSFNIGGGFVHADMLGRQVDPAPDDGAEPMEV